MPERDVIVIGASAGGVETLVDLCRLLPSDLPAAVFIVLHTVPDGPGLLPKILSRYSAIPAIFPRDGEKYVKGKIYIAPPGQHLLVHRDRIELSNGPKENLLRPSIDVLFRSAAQAFGPRVIGVILSGTRNDGIAGLVEIQRRGGITVVQDPQEALFPGLPENALQLLNVDFVQPTEKIAQTLNRMTREPYDLERPGKPMSENNSKEKRIVQRDKHAFERSPEETQRSVLTCPECGGVLWELHDGQLVHYTCHVGHSYTEGSLLEGQSEALEEALWVAIRSLEERASLSRRLAERASQSGKLLVYERFQRQAEEAERAANVVRTIVTNGMVINPVEKDDNGDEPKV